VNKRDKNLGKDKTVLMLMICFTRVKFYKFNNFRKWKDRSIKL